MLTGSWKLFPTLLASGSIAAKGKTGVMHSDDERWWVIGAAAAGAALGSKVLYWFEDPRLTLAHRSDPVFLLAGKTIVGGLIGGLFCDLPGF